MESTFGDNFIFLVWQYAIDKMIAMHCYEIKGILCSNSCQFIQPIQFSFFSQVGKDRKRIDQVERTVWI